MLNHAVDQQLTGDKVNIAGGEPAPKIISLGRLYRIKSSYTQVADALAHALFHRVHHAGIISHLNSMGVLWGNKWLLTNGIGFNDGVGQQLAAD
ncbi:hypothetical protein ES703_78794 [subsurface metagenome]